MKTAVLSLLAMLPASLESRAAEIPSGTHLLLKMVNSVNTRTAAEGNQVYLRTDSPLVADGHVIVPVGSYVQGTVAQLKRSGRVAGRAELAIRLDTLTLPEGKVLKFTPQLSAVDAGDSGQKTVGENNRIQQGPDIGHDAARIAILAGTGATIGGLADRSWRGAGIGAAAGGAVGVATTLLARGREVELRQGMSLDVALDRALFVE
jgi:type IV secretion system protein VirB10